MVFARKVWKLLVALKDGLSLLFLLLFFGLLYAGLASRPTAGRVEEGALLLDLAGTLVEEKSPIDPFALVTSEEVTTEHRVRDLDRALRLAATDKRVKVVVLDLSRFLGGSFVHLQDVGKAVDAVRAAGKPVLTFANIYSDDSTQLAAHASEVWVDPMGGAFVAGPGGNYLFYKGLLDRFKVNAHVYRVGTYKSFVEPYVREKFSEEAREDIGGVYRAVWDQYRAEIAKARPKAQLERMVADPVAWSAAAGGDMAKAAKAVGLVDRIGDFTEFQNRVTGLAGETTAPGRTSGALIPYAHTTVATFLAAHPAKAEGAAIGVVTIAGEIVDGDAGPGRAGGERIARLLDEHIDDELKALVVRIDSPGGSVMASERIRRALLRYREKKIPIVVSMANQAASGGYWVATPGQRIFAEAGTITGSIGVFAVLPSFENTLRDYGVTTDGVATTPLSGQPDLFAGFTPEVDALLQGSVENVYGQFLGVVAKARGKTPQQVDAIAQGRVWAGLDARRIGLVDEIGGLDAALAHAARLGGVGNGKWHAAYIEDKENPVNALLASFAGNSGEQAAAYDMASLVAVRQQAQLRQVAARVEALVGTRGMQAYCLACAVEPEAPVRRTQRRDDGAILRLLAMLAGKG